MSLKDLVPEPRVLTFPKGSVTVYPLTIHDLVLLLSHHELDMNSLMEGQLDIPKLLAKAPVLAASLIAYAAREPGEIETVAKLPFAVQLLALEAIWDASALDGDMLGKLVLRLAEGVRGLNSQLKEQSDKVLLPSGGSLGM